MTKNTIKILSESGLIEDAQLLLEITSGGYSTVTIILKDGRKFFGTDTDWFNGFRSLRKRTDKLGIKILVQASRPNCWPSGMSAQMSNGKKIYERSLAKGAETWPIVDSFDEADISEIGTLKEQDEFNKSFYDSKKAR